MREIKFRGMSERCFVYGDLLSNCNGKNGPYVAIKDTVSHINDSYIDIIPTAVKPETVGQFTGLLDKNGKEIFEGDIIEYPSGMIKECPESESNQVIDGHFYKTIPNKTGVIIFDAPSFCVKNGCNLGSRGLKKEDITVIGSIHENPELLK